MISPMIDPPARLRPLPMLIFSSRWLQLPLYLGLIVAQCFYVFLFLKVLVQRVAQAIIHMAFILSAIGTSPGRIA